MTGRERVRAALTHREGDRVPIYVWVFDQPGVIELINQRHGSMDGFADAMDLDMIQAFPTGGPLPAGALPGRYLTLDEALEVALTDPADPRHFGPIERAVEHDQGRRGRAVFVQTPGVFECSNGFLGIQDHLMALALRPDDCARLYQRIADWSCGYIDACVDRGVDVIHVSDDWGMNDGPLFRPATWEQFIRPATARIAQRAKDRGAFLSLHSDGDINAFLDGIAEMGFDVIHPVQESAGMDMVAVKRRYAGRLALYGGLDVRTVLGRGTPELVEDEVRRVMRTLKPGGGYIFCTSHMVQPGTPLDEVERMLAVAREEAVS